MALKSLFSPFSIGNLKLENRIVMPPMATNYATLEGFVSDRQIAYYVDRAKGGVGYITVEHTAIHEQGKASPKMLMISTDEHAAKIENLVEAVHAAGGKIVVQINHAGRQTFSKVTGAPIVGPSAVPVSPAMETPHELSAGEIEDLVNLYTRAAERVKKTGARVSDLFFPVPVFKQKEGSVWRRYRRPDPICLRGSSIRTPAGGAGLSGYLQVEW
jgi:2,4-dienoyl-CoA reductase-like NADH-dependent reductase (Old Yellow Enzyme family)